MYKKLLSTLTLLFLFVPAAWAQTGTVTGEVTDAESGETIPGVNVVLDELDRGAATNPDGSYTISDVPTGTYTLRVSFVGYDPFEAEVTIEANETVTQDVQLQTGAVGLDEVVVTGYGSEQAREVTGSISGVSSEEINDVPAQNAQSLLQGRAAGVTMATTSGNPGGGFEVNIRGVNSIDSGDDPLYIVDGTPLSTNQSANLNDKGPLSSLNPRDIESIEVLKDAAAASIYGAQAANGVVLITTKEGREGETQVSVNYEGGVRQPMGYYDMMSRDQWLDFHVDAFGEEETREGYVSGTYGYDSDTPFDELADTDWQDLVTRSGAHHSVGFTANGGDANTQFYISGDWESTEGGMREVSWEAFNFRTNISQQFTDRLNFDAKINLHNNEMPGICQDGGYVNCPTYQAVGEEAPISYPYLDNGEYNPNTEEGLNNNPAVVLNEEERDTRNTEIIGSIAPSYTFAPWLTLRGSVSLDWKRLRETDHERPIADPGVDGSTRERFNTITNVTGNLTLDAQRTVAENHDVNLLAGTEYRRETEHENDYSVQGFTSSLLSVQDAASEIDFWEGWHSEYRMLSFFGQAKYDYDDRYLLTLTTRYDGSSKFGADRRWGVFPSASVAWRLSEESFFTADFVDDLKLRASYGITGNSQIDNFQARGIYGVSDSYEGRTGFNSSRLANSQLTWEENREINLGLDWSFWSSRLTGSFEVYRSRSRELLLDRPLPVSSGFSSIKENIGSLENRGIEVSFETVNLQDFHGLTWRTRFNAGVVQDEILELSEGVEAIDPAGSIPRRVGYSQYARQGARWAGVNPADGRPMWYDKDGNITYNPTQEDDVMQDGAMEDVEGGFGNRLTYGGLSLDVFFQFSYGGNALPSAVSTYSYPNGENALEQFATERWREPGDVARWPRAEPLGNFEHAMGYTSYESQWFWRNDYIRLKNVTLSYQMPSGILETLRLDGARIYASGLNLATWTTYIGLDPEVAGTSTTASYPSERQYNVGIEITL